MPQLEAVVVKQGGFTLGGGIGMVFLDE